MPALRYIGIFLFLGVGTLGASGSHTTTTTSGATCTNALVPTVVSRALFGLDEKAVPKDYGRRLNALANALHVQDRFHLLDQFEAERTNAIFDARRGRHVLVTGHLQEALTHETNQEMCQMLQKGIDEQQSAVLATSITSDGKSVGCTRWWFYPRSAIASAYLLMFYPSLKQAFVDFNVTDEHAKMVRAFAKSADPDVRYIGQLLNCTVMEKAYAKMLDCVYEPQIRLRNVFCAVYRTVQPACVAQRCLGYVKAATDAYRASVLHVINGCLSNSAHGHAGITMTYDDEQQFIARRLQAYQEYAQQRNALVGLFASAMQTLTRLFKSAPRGAEKREMLHFLSGTDGRLPDTLELSQYPETALIKEASWEGESVTATKAECASTCCTKKVRQKKKQKRTAGAHQRQVGQHGHKYDACAQDTHTTSSQQTVPVDNNEAETPPVQVGGAPENSCAEPQNDTASHEPQAVPDTAVNESTALPTCTCAQQEVSFTTGQNAQTQKKKKKKKVTASTSCKDQGDTSARNEQNTATTTTAADDGLAWVDAMPYQSDNTGLDEFHSHAVIHDRSNQLNLYVFNNATNDRLPQSVDITYRPTGNVNQWFANTRAALNEQGYCTLGHKNYAASDAQRLYAIQIHRFSRFLDKYAHTMGRCYKVPSREVPNQMDIGVAIPGQVEFLNRTNGAGQPVKEHCFFVYLIDSATGTCYHRNIVPCNMSDIMSYWGDGSCSFLKEDA